MFHNMTVLSKCSVNVDLYIILLRFHRLIWRLLFFLLDWLPIASIRDMITCSWRSQPIKTPAQQKGGVALRNSWWGLVWGARAERLAGRWGKQQQARQSWGSLKHWFGPLFSSRRWDRPTVFLHKLFLCALTAHSGTLLTETGCIFLTDLWDY